MQSIQLTHHDLGKMVISYFGDYVGHICEVDTNKNFLKTKYNFCGLSKITEEWIDAKRIKDSINNVIRLFPEEYGCWGSPPT